MLQRINLIGDVRLTQVEKQKDFRQGYNKLLRAYRQLVAAGPARTMPSPQEQALLDKQQHYEFSELSQQEQMKLKGELDSMWGQIPAHLQEKARGLAGVS